MSYHFTLFKINYYILIFIIFFFLSLTAIYVFNLNTLEALLRHHWQIADIGELSKSPFTSWIYIHSQPPLLNFLIAIFSQFNGKTYQIFTVINCLSIAATATIINYVINKYISKYKWVGFCSSFAYLIAPSTLLNSAYPFYPVLTSLGYALLILAFFEYENNKMNSRILLVLSVIYLTLLRSSFSPIIAVVILMIYFVLIDNHLTLRRLVLISIVGLFPILLISTKNLIMYDFWGGSSWAPINIAKGFGSPVELNYFPSPDQIRLELPEIRCLHGYKSIDSETRKNDGNPNYNSCYFLAFAESQKSTIWSNYDLNTHLKRIASHIARYFSLPDKYQYLSNRASIYKYAEAYNKLFLTLEIRDGYHLRLTILFLMLLTFFLLVRNNNKNIKVLYLIFLIHFISHVLTDGDEGDRFVFDVEFLFYIFGAYLYVTCFGKKSINSESQPIY